jgi:hypothetical protein
MDRQVVSGLARGEDVVLLTNRGVVRISPGGQTRSSLPCRTRGMDGRGLLDLPDGDVQGFWYGRIHDSGVQVVRLEPGSGKEVWQVHCDSLGVLHSAYHHRVAVTVEEGQVKVVSRGSGGAFVELLEFTTRRRVGRTQRLGH